MNQACQTLPAEAVDELHQRGFVFLSKWRTDIDTLQLAIDVGRVIDTEALIGSSSITTVQMLKPRSPRESELNTYSGNFGLGEFPLHTDMAHCEVLSI